MNEIKNYDKIFFERFASGAKLSADEVKSLIAVKSKHTIPTINEIDFSTRHKVKLGIDPTGSELHLGHLCPLIVLDIFARGGHHVDFIIGDFTSKIGDPSGRVSDRPAITDEIIAQNFATYTAQVSRYLNIKNWTVTKNSKFLAPMKFSDFLGIAQNINAATILQRDDFRTRIAAGGVTLAELTYGILQGLDSLHIGSTIELGGADQLLNLQQGREIQRMHKQKPQAVITNPLLEGLDGSGKKMGKSLNNYVSLTATLEDKFGLIMSMSDTTILQYFTSLAHVFENEVADLASAIKQKPLEMKKQLATYLVAIEARDITAGQNERAKFEQKFAKKELTMDDFKTINTKPDLHLLDILMSSGEFKSKGELKRLLEEGAIRDLSDNAVIENDFVIMQNEKIKVGKRKFYNIVVS